MKIFIHLILLQFSIIVASAQQSAVDSLKRELLTAKQDTNRVFLLAALSYAYLYSSPDTAILFAQEGYDLSQQLNFLKGRALCLNRIAIPNVGLGNAPKALELLQKSLALSEQINDQVGIGRSLNNIANFYAEQGDHTKALLYLLKAKKVGEVIQNPIFSEVILQNIGESYYYLNQQDSALFYTQKAYALSEENPTSSGDIQRILGDIYAKKNNQALALEYYRESIINSTKFDDVQHTSRSYHSIAKLYQAKGQTDSTIFYAQKALEKAQTGGFAKEILNASHLLSEVYENKKQYADAFRYFKIATAAKDSMFSQEKVKQLLTLGFEEKIKQQEMDAANSQYKDKIKIYLLLAGFIVLLLIAIILIRYNRQKQKAYTLLQKQKQEIELQKAKVESALKELRTTQTQLVQSEKMASLGELTAGIAHEIQNPLNFVNNFSEVNTELIEELQAERSKVNGERNEASEDQILSDVKQNLEKILHHGKRADAIVKAMLQHSRISTGQKELTDINALADEYLRLSYHGLRAKDKSFNATVQTDFDPGVGKINIVSQDIGRALLNLFNNAFYAVTEKRKSLFSLKGDKNYEPTVSVITKRIYSPTAGGDGAIEIHVKDNGNGIPQKVLNKIFQPFFTTKPAGEGTGLGLSLSYDIVKIHHGEIKIDTNEGEGAELIIELPILL